MNKGDIVKFRPGVAPEFLSNKRYEVLDTVTVDGKQYFTIIDDTENIIDAVDDELMLVRRAGETALLEKFRLIWYFPLSSLLYLQFKYGTVSGICMWLAAIWFIGAMITIICLSV
jgi:hypothetical protein